MSISLDFPQRYEPIEQLGSGGGGEVWSVRDRHTGRSYALKVLAEGATEHERAALVREAVALSGLEGLGLPEVLRFGRLARSARPYMIRDLVPGQSLETLIGEGASWHQTVGVLCAAAEQLTEVHRAGFLHGDVKPANIIATAAGATLVDLGLSAHFLEAGSRASGLTPKYAAPELLAGGPLTVRAEVYALGVALRDIAGECDGELSELEPVVRRATHDEPSHRFPSADEFAAALRRAAGLPPRDVLYRVGSSWPIVGIDSTAGRLVGAANQLSAGEALLVVGRDGSGRSVLLRRLAWSLGVEGTPLVWVDEFLAASPEALASELSAFPSMQDLVIIVDDVACVSERAMQQLRAARAEGACLVVASAEEPSEDVVAAPLHRFEVPRLTESAALELLKRAVPSLTEKTARRVLLAACSLPGELRRVVGLLALSPVVSEEDIDDVLLGARRAPLESITPENALERAVAYLNRGRYNEAEQALALAESGDPLTLAVSRARLFVGLGDGRRAYDELMAVEGEARARAESPEAQYWKVWLGRSEVALSRSEEALPLLREVTDKGAIGAEALAFEGLALHYLGDQAGALDSLTRASEWARTLGDGRVEALAHIGLGLIQQRADALDEAEAAYRAAVACAQRVGDAGALGTAQLNLGVLHRVRGDVARALECFEAALDMGRRSGRKNTVRFVLLGLANADLYLGRLARAQAGIESLLRQQEALSRFSRAQLLGSQAELELKQEHYSEAVALFARCAEAYVDLGMASSAAEAELEGVLAAVHVEGVNVLELTSRVNRARASLGDSEAHGALVSLAAARVAMVGGDEEHARGLLATALAAARGADQRDWIWRVLETRAELEEGAGQHVTARRDRLEAVTILEEIGAGLSRDLREVFWNDPRRRRLRCAVEGALVHAPTQLALGDSTSLSSPISAYTRTPLEQRLARLLDINQELLGEMDLEKLAAKAIEYAVELVHAERGFVILEDEQCGLRVYSSSHRAGDAEHLDFSRSIAESVISSREPVVSARARDDARLQGFRSVHQLMLESVACVPIVARLRAPIGALYVESRQRSGERFERELPTLRAFADQVALAIETQQLVNENKQRAEALATANEQLQAAQVRLKELLGQRTESLKATRRELRAVRDVILSHFGYQGIVGTSDPMRRCYALIDRVKDTQVPVLITGESGTGKELVARALHRGSERGKLPFLGVNCGAIPEHLLESELFGHVRGAFTGADRARRGLLRDAGAGTVLLDEIGEMPHKMQAGLLRVLQERKVRPVGGTEEEPIACRFVFATHRNLREMVDAGTFREDLYYRIVVVEVQLPTLRDRLDDLPLLVDHFLGIFAARYQRPKRSLSKDALRLLATYSWPGNVRQLEHVLLSAWVMSDDDEIVAADLEFPQRPLSRPPSGPPPAIRDTKSLGPKEETLSAHRRGERERIIEALERSNWNRVRAAELAGIPRRTFYRRLREYKIQ